MPKSEGMYIACGSCNAAVRMSSMPTQELQYAHPDTSVYQGAAALLSCAYIPRPT